MNDAATMTGTGRTVTVGGESHTITPLSVTDFGKLQAWVDRQFGDPFELANAQVATGKYNTAQQQFLYRTAFEIARQPKPRIGTPEADELLRSLDGFRQMLVLSIQKAEPGFTDADASRLYDVMTPGDISRAYSLTELSEVMSDPKAETDGMPPSP